MHMSKQIYMALSAALLFGGCSQFEPSDEMDAVQKGLGQAFIQPNNQVLQGCSWWYGNAAEITIQGLVLKSTDASGVQSWAMRLISNPLDDPWTYPEGAVTLTFAAPKKPFPGKPVKSLSTNKGWLVVTWFDGTTATSTTTTTMNSTDPEGERLLIRLPTPIPYTGNNNAFVISSKTNTATAGQYQLRMGSDYQGIKVKPSVNEPAQQPCRDYFNQYPVSNSWEVTMTPFGGMRWDVWAAQRFADSNFISFASNVDALGGCESWGYGPWSTRASYFDVCTRAKRADLCGNGVPWTPPHNDTTVNVQIFDNIVGGNSPSPQTYSTIEAWYTETGATCVNVQRFRAEPLLPPYFNPNTTCGRVLPACTATSTGKMGIAIPM